MGFVKNKYISRHLSHLGRHSVRSFMKHRLSNRRDCKKVRGFVMIDDSIVSLTSRNIVRESSDMQGTKYISC